jgi:hypothetical protein
MTRKHCEGHKHRMHSITGIKPVAERKIANASSKGSARRYVQFTSNLTPHESEYCFVNNGAKLQAFIGDSHTDALYCGI